MLSRCMAQKRPSLMIFVQKLERWIPQTTEIGGLAIFGAAGASSNYGPEGRFDDEDFSFPNPMFSTLSRIIVEKMCSSLPDLS